MKNYLIILLLFLSYNAVAIDVNTPSKKTAVGQNSPVPVSFVNKKSSPLYVSFTIDNTAQSAGVIVLSSSKGCGAVSTGQNASSFSIAAKTTCSATVDPTQFTVSSGTPLGSTRFCASTASAPVNCMLAQSNSQTTIETTFLPFSSGSCFSKASCVWYDISVIPSNCTNPLWEKNYCANTGGASYNIPVQLSCSGQPTYTCQGPANTIWGNSNYPGKCGNPIAKCATGSQVCTSPNKCKPCSNGISAYFFPTPPKSPNAVCPNGKILTITFLTGQ